MIAYNANNVTPCIATDVLQNLYCTYITRGTVSGGNTYDGSYNVVVFKLGEGFNPCLLEGTLVQTPTGYVPIETLHVDDEILSHTNTIRKITKIHRGRCFYKNRNLEDILYRIPAGTLGAKHDVYLSHYHKILHDGKILYPVTLGFQEATYDEITKDGFYNIYNLAVERGLYSYLVVNGGCIVESWIE